MARENRHVDTLAYAELQRCNRDLTSLLALPALWHGQPPPALAHSLSDALVALFRPEVVYIVLRTSSNAQLAEVVRAAEATNVAQLTSELRALVSPRDPRSGTAGPFAIHVDGGASLTVLPIPIGVYGESGWIAIGSRNPDFPSSVDRLTLRTAANLVLVSLHGALLLQSREHLVSQLKALADAAAQLQSIRSRSAMLERITAQARELIGAHRARTILFDDKDASPPLGAVSLSEECARGSTGDERSTTFEADSSRASIDRPIRLTRTQLELRDAPRAAVRRPPMRGCLAVPLTGLDGATVGSIELSDKFEGDFSEEDASILTQFAQLASAALENARLYEQLQDADRRKDEFIAMLAHELRNPLAPIGTSLHLLERAPAQPAIAEQARAVIARQVSHMIRLVDDLLDVSRITLGRLELRREHLQLDTVIAAAIDAARPLIDARSHELTVSLPPEPIPLYADPIRLAQVLANLLNNAAKYTPEAGRIWLSAERRGGEATISVRDTGIGIAPDKLNTLFTLFTQVARNEAIQQGLGIGLHLAKRLVEMHDGRIAASSPGEGRGAEFIVILPVAGVESSLQTIATATRAGAPAAQSGLRILVADDNRDAAESLTMLLKLGGHEVRTAYDGEQAVECAAAFRPALALLDVGMPKLTGDKVALELRAQFGAEATLVALTGWGTRELGNRIDTSVFDAHLTKPVDFVALEALLESIAGRIGARVRA